MRVLLAILLATTAFAFVPQAVAHSCQGINCGPCVKGEMHAHQDSKGQCSSGPGYFTDQGYGGQSASVPGLGVVGLVAAAALVALVARR